MRPWPAILLAALSWAGVPAAAQPAAPAASAAPQQAGLDILMGRWVRPDGGYVIDIRSVGAGGKLDLELRAGGYNGSNYTLTYNPAKDTLEGVYYQAVAKQRFDVRFARAK